MKSGCNIDNAAHLAHVAQIACEEIYLFYLMDPLRYHMYMTLYHHFLNHACRPVAGMLLVS